jgi:hypothetical protein
VSCNQGVCGIWEKLWRGYPHVAATFADGEEEEEQLVFACIGEGVGLEAPFAQGFAEFRRHELVHEIFALLLLESSFLL